VNGTQSPLNVRQLRAVQIFCLLLAVSACWLVAHTGEPKTNAEFGPTQWAIVLMAAYCAVSGFTFQRFLNKERPRSRPGGTGSTPYRRWSIGHLLRLATACSVALWGASPLSLKGLCGWPMHSVDWEFSWCWCGRRALRLQIAPITSRKARAAEWRIFSSYN